MASLEVLSPVANVVEQSVKPAPRLRDLGHATAHPELGWLMRHCTAEDADRIAAEVDAVVGTTND